MDGDTRHNAFPNSADTREITMKLNYYADTDFLYIDLSSSVSSDSKEIADGLVVDFDDSGLVVASTSSTPPNASISPPSKASISRWQRKPCSPKPS